MQNMVIKRRDAQTIVTKDGSKSFRERVIEAINPPMAMRVNACRAAHKLSRHHRRKIKQ